MVFTTKIKWEEELTNIKDLGSTGHSMSELATIYGVSRQRIKQIVDKYIPNWKDDYGFAIRRNRAEAAYHQKWGDKEPTELYQRKRDKFRSKKAAAIRTGWEWSIDFGDLEWPTHCPILGIELDYFAETIQENCVSFDQIDAGKGYVKGNVQLISWRANRIKNNGTATEHRMIADYLDSIA